LTLAALFIVSAPAGTRALGALEYPSIEESVAGVRGILCGAFPLYADTQGAARSARVAVEASENLLFGISGLRTSGVRLGVRVGSAVFVGEATQLTADVGREARYAFAPALFVRDLWAVSVGVVYEGAFVDGFPPARMVSVCGRSLIRLSQSVRVGGEIDRYRVHGEPGGGADVSIVVLVRPVPGALFRGVVELGRWGGAQPSLSTTVEALPALRLSFGYEGATDALKGAVAVGIGGLTCAAGVIYHPVLGARKGVTVSWRR
jgi:hypothetical protein